MQLVHPLSTFHATLQVPGDKSLSHRALIFGALADGITEVRGLLNSADVRSTAACLAQMGVQIETLSDRVRVHGVGLHGLKAPSAPLDCGNSGTTLRLLMGILAAQPFASTLVGDASLSCRPMARVAEPLRQMGAEITLREGRFAPVVIQGAPLKGLDYTLPVASAQLKSALLLAGLYASEPVVLRGELASRDHTERLLPHFGVHLEVQADQIRTVPGQSLRAADFQVPGDPSTAAFWLAAAALLPGAEVQLPQVSLNPGRLGFVRVLQRMGAEVSLSAEADATEPRGLITLRQAPLQGTSVMPAEIPDLIDEVPLLAVLATQARGRTEVRGAEELRIKESDRLEAMAENLGRMGIQMELFSDGFALEGPQPLRGAVVHPHHDHRIAMACAIAGLCADGPTQIQDPDCVAISYPAFFETLTSLPGAR
ncbi:MAG: 3-phosphoshikimate 1-carboxyvinyltransferase [Candidatus Sericytochromatia bacterium]